MSEAVYEIPLKRIDGTPTRLGEFEGKVILVVNVASACGLTPQYATLQALYDEKAAQGLVVAGFPANEFGAQEPGADPEIAVFCSTKYGVTFPMFSKIVVKGPDQHPLYQHLVAAQPRAIDKPGSNFKAQLASYGIKPETDSEILWNFEKFLIGKNGKVVARFAPDVAGDDPLLRAAVEKELAA